MSRKQNRQKTTEKSNLCVRNGNKSIKLPQRLVLLKTVIKIRNIMSHRDACNQIVILFVKRCLYSNSMVVCQQLKWVIVLETEQSFASFSVLHNVEELCSGI